VLRFGSSYEGIADSTCSATTIRARRDEWINAGIFVQLKQIVLEAYDRIVGLILTDIAVDGCITKAPGSGECAGLSPVDRGKQGWRGSQTGVLISRLCGRFHSGFCCGTARVSGQRAQEYRQPEE
jgi:transposase